MLNPLKLRELIFADGVTALALLLFGLVVTFGSASMGTAIMALGKERSENRGGKSADELLSRAPAQLLRK